MHCERFGVIRLAVEKGMTTTNESTAAIRSNHLRVAVVQAAPILFDTPKSLKKLTDLSANAAKQGAELVVFPEAFIGGYPKGHGFGVTLGIRSPDGREEFRRLYLRPLVRRGCRPGSRCRPDTGCRGSTEAHPNCSARLVTLPG